MFIAKPKILIVSGSMRRDSLTRPTLKYVEALAAERGLAPEFICARELNLPIFDPPASDALPNVMRWREAVRSSAGMIVGSPEYHGSFSGVLKNMIDYLGMPHLKGKPIGLIACSGSAKTGVGTLNALRVVFRAIHAPVIIEQASFFAGDFSGDDRQINPDALAQMRGVVDGMAREVERNLSSSRAAECAIRAPM